MPATVQRRWDAYSAAEKLTWSVLTVTLLAVLLWLYGLQPLAERYAEARQSKVEAEETLQFLQRAAPQLRVLTNGAVADTETVQSMTNLVSRTAADNEVALTRFEQSGADGLRIWLDNQSFDRVLIWMAELDTHGVEVDQLTLSQGNGPGLVTVRGVVTRR